jgi:putative oxidoreductase
MHPLRRVARVLLASTFVAGGVDGLLKPERRVPRVEGALDQAPSGVPGLEGVAAEDLVRITGGVQAGAGSLLALNRLPRLSSVALAGSLAAETAALHRFWELKAPQQRREQQTLFLKNLSLLGGLLIAAVDTEGRPGIAWRAKHAADHAGKAAKRATADAEKAAKRARREAKVAAKGAKANARVAAKVAKADSKIAAKAATARTKALV